MLVFKYLGFLFCFVSKPPFCYCLLIKPPLWLENRTLVCLEPLKLIQIYFGLLNESFSLGWGHVCTGMARVLMLVGATPSWLIIPIRRRFACPANRWVRTIENPDYKCGAGCFILRVYLFSLHSRRSSFIKYVPFGDILLIEWALFITTKRSSLSLTLFYNQNLHLRSISLLQLFPSSSGLFQIWFGFVFGRKFLAVQAGLWRAK